MDWTTVCHPRAQWWTSPTRKRQPPKSFHRHRTSLEHTMDTLIRVSFRADTSCTEPLQGHTNIQRLLRKSTTSRLRLCTQARSQIIRLRPPSQHCRAAVLAVLLQARAKFLLHIVQQQLPIQVLRQMTLAQKMAYWSTVAPCSRLRPLKTARLHVSQTPLVFHLRLYPVKARATHRSTHLRTLLLRECNSTTSTITTGTVIYVLRDDTKHPQQDRCQQQRL